MRDRNLTVVNVDTAALVRVDFGTGIVKGAVGKEGHLAKARMIKGGVAHTLHVT